MRSPKPSNRRSSSRIRQRKSDPSAAPSGQGISTRSLKKLGRELPTIEEFDQIDRDALTAHDRTVAILLVSQVERFLEIAIISHLFLQDDDTVDLLIARDGPLSSFYSKIILAYAMGFIATNEKDDLDNYAKSAMLSLMLYDQLPFGRNRLPTSSRHCTPPEVITI